MNLIQRLHTYFSTVDPQRFSDVHPSTITDAASLVPTVLDGVCWTAIFACTRTTFHPAPSISGLQFVVLDQHSSLLAIKEGLDMNARGFDPAAPAATDAEAERFRAGLLANRAFTAKLDGQPVAAGMFTPPLYGVTELVGITTLAPYRQRGIGAALTSELVRVAFAHNIDVPILRTDNPAALRVYQHIGFVPVAMLMTKSEPVVDRE